jgi:radical SAM protein with 4Fe4S-binding SPASM domain
MHPGLFGQIEYAKSAGVPILGISTNATLLDRKNANAILDSPLDRILIAVDGARKETYEAVRKSSSFTFEQVRANIEQFLALKLERRQATPETTLSIIVMEDNKDQLQAFADHWTQRGADKILFKPFTAWGNQTDDFTHLAAAEQRELLQRALRPHPCRYLWESVVIAWDGRVVPCCFDYNATMVMGDLRTQTLAEIWNSEDYVRFRRMELEGTNASSLCRNCSEAPGSPRDPNFPEPV